MINFPLDIWKEIIARGQLSIEDVLNLMSTCKTLCTVLRENSMWYTLLYDNYLCMMLQYELPKARELVEKRGCREAEVDFYRECIKFYKKEKEFLLFLHGVTDARDEFTYDQDYIPILHKLHRQLPRSYINMLRNDESVHLRDASIILDYLKRQTFGLGYSVLKGRINHPGPSFEYLWLNIGLLDSSAVLQIESRQKVLDSIFKLLNVEIRGKLFHNNSVTSKIQLLPGEKKDILLLQDENTFTTLIQRIFKVALSCLRFHNPLVPVEDKVVYEKYIKSYYFEDFSILRVYGGQAKGHPFLISAILIKVLHQFLLTNYQIQFIGSDSYEDVPMDITASYLKVKNHVFLLDRKVLPTGTDFIMYSIDEVQQSLRARNWEIFSALNPIRAFDFVKSYLFLKKISSEKSLSEITRPCSYFENDKHAAELGEYTCGSMTYDNYMYAKTMYRYVDEAGTEQSNRLLPLLHVSYIRNPITNLPQISHFLRSFPSTFDFRNPKCLNWYTDSHKFYPVEDTGENICTGSIVQHKRSSSYGVVLGQYLANDGSPGFFHVYTIGKTIGFYYARSIKLVDSNTKNLPQVLNFVIKMCGEELLTAFCFDTLVDPLTRPRFIRTY